MAKTTKSVSKKELSTGISFASSTYYPKSRWRPYNPDDLVRKFGGNSALTVYEGMKTDDIVKAALYVKKAAVLSSGWRIEPASEDDSDKEIADFIDDNFRQWFVGNFDSALKNILSAIEYGFSVTEKIFEYDGSIYLKELKTQPPHSFEFDTDVYGNLTELKQWTNDGRQISLPIDKFIIYTHEKESGNYYGNSDLRAAYRSWFSKDIIIKFWNMYLERFGMPIIIAKTGATTNTPDREKLQEMLDNLQAKSSYIIPEDVEIEIKEAIKSSGGDYDKAIEKHNNAIRNSILMPKGIGFSDTEGGSRAKADVEKDVLIWVADEIRHNLESIINSTLIRQLVDLNFPSIEKYPMFRFNPISEEDKDKKATTIIKGIADGAIIPDLEVQNKLRVLLDLPETEELPETPMFEEEEKEEFVLSRPLTKYEKKMDFALAQKSLVKDVEVAILDIKEAIRKIRDDFTTQVMRKRIIEDQNIAGVNKIQFRYIRDLGLLVEGVLRNSYKDGVKFAKSGVKKKYAQNPTKIGLVESKSIMWIKEQSKLLTGGVSGALQDNAKVVLMDGIKRGASVAQVVTDLEEVFDKYVAVENVQGSTYTSGRLYTAVNTAYASAFTVGMEEFYKPLEIAGELEAYQWSSILDNSTTPGCQELNGKVYGASNGYWNEINPPRHYNCRSLKVPVLLGEGWTESAVLSVGREF